MKVNTIMCVFWGSFLFKQMMIIPRNNSFSVDRQDLFTINAKNFLKSISLSLIREFVISDRHSNLVTGKRSHVTTI